MWFPLESVIFGSTPPLDNKSSTIVALFLSSSSIFKVSAFSSSAFILENSANTICLPHHMGIIMHHFHNIIHIYYLSDYYFFPLEEAVGKLYEGVSTLPCLSRWPSHCSRPLIPIKPLLHLHAHEQ